MRTPFAEGCRRRCCSETSVKRRAGSQVRARVILTGGTVFGDVRVRARRLLERISERPFGALRT